MSRRTGLAATLAALLSVLVTAGPSRASSYLLYLEAQGVAGYSSNEEKPIFYTMSQEEIMQKPTIGFDFLGRVSGGSGDLGTAALQVRLAWNEDPEEGQDRWEPQVYNAYLKAKIHWTDVWVGHNRPALGLSSYFDSHGLVLRTLAMQGFGFDRDWGVGVYRDFSWGNAAASLTTGTGAPIYARGNYMAAGRVSWGVLSQENWNMGFSLAGGRTLETEGYALLDGDPREMRVAAVDLTLLRDNFEHRFDAEAGRLWDERALGLFYRLGWILDEETRWKLEAQPTYLRWDDEDTFQFSLCASHLATSDLTVRTAYIYDSAERDHRVLLQLYWYHLL